MKQTNGTSRLAIRVMERCDLEDLRQLHNHDGTLAMLTDVQHITEAQQEAWYQAISLSKTSRRYVARLRADDSFVGMMRVDQIDLANRNCFIGCDISYEMRGKGFATEFFSYLLNYYFNNYGLHRVQLVTLSSNSQARRLYHKLGFVEEGISREAIYRDGSWHDLLAMGLLKRDWRKSEDSE